MPRGKDKFKDLEKLSFEEALSRLEGIVEGMEDGKAPLEEMISRFEEGGALAGTCQKRLDELQRKIEILSKDSPQGPVWREFKPDGGVQEEEEEPAEAQAAKDADSLF